MGLIGTHDGNSPIFFFVSGYYDVLLLLIGRTLTANIWSILVLSSFCTYAPFYDLYDVCTTPQLGFT
jgi:hypothetical protein